MLQPWPQTGGDDASTEAADECNRRNNCAAGGRRRRRACDGRRTGRRQRRPAAATGGRHGERGDARAPATARGRCDAGLEEQRQRVSRMHPAVRLDRFRACSAVPVAATVIRERCVSRRWAAERVMR